MSEGGSSQVTAPDGGRAAFSQPGNLTRREFLGRGGAAVGAVALGGLMAACGGTTKAANKPIGTVNYFGWQGYDDAKARKPFEAAGGKLRISYISSNDETLTKLRGGALGVYDIVTPSSSYLHALVAANLLQPLDYSKLPNAKGYAKVFYKPPWNTFDGHTWGAPVQWGDAPLVYRPDLITKLPATWQALADPIYKNKVAMWDDGYGHIVTMARALGFKPPDMITHAQLDQVVTWMTRIRQNARVIASSLGDLGDILARGDASITTESYEGVAMAVRAKGKPAKWYTPPPGSWGWNDHYAIPKEASNPDGAYAFINAMIAPRASATISEDLATGTPVQAAVSLLDPTTKSLYNYGNLKAGLYSLGFYSLPPLSPAGDIATFDEWNAAWERIKG